MESPDTYSVTFAAAGERGYPVAFRPLSQLPRLMSEAGLRIGRCLLVSDDRVEPLYADLLVESLRSFGWRPVLATVPAGEPSKSLAMLSDLLNWGLEQRIDRRTPVIALGGGVVGDLAGFAAASLLRGLPFVQVPTTLIAQVDSAIGGKTGINHELGKNLIGAFHQPALVCADVAALLTLPAREWNSGLAETVKHALIGDRDLFAYLLAHWDAILRRDLDSAAPAIRRSAGVKVGIVSRDEREGGERAHLNFGHTFGHALENACGYGLLTHGEAVALGMRAALHLSRLLRPALDVEPALELVGAIPVEADLAGIDRAAVEAAMLLDKKRVGARLRFVVLEEIGRARVTDEVRPEQLEAALDTILEPHGTIDA